MTAGTNVASGQLITPGGAQGIPGPNAVSTDAGNQATWGSDSKIYVPDPTPKITSVRLRSFNAVGNPTWETDQRQASLPGGLMSANGAIWVADRWIGYNTTGVTPYASPAAWPQAVDLPGTSFRISQSFLNFSIQSVSKPTLVAADQLIFQQSVEGINMRELIDDVHSISILAQTNVAGGLKFALSLQDGGGTRSLCKLCTIPTSNVWTLITLPNLPIWGSGGGWTTALGAVGYVLFICLAAGSNNIPPANDTWQNGSFRGAVGMDNILSKPSNSSFMCAFVQHEPGSLCTTLIDKPFTQNLDECQRYYFKTWSYATAVGTGVQVGCNATFRAYGTGGANGYAPFAKRMGKVPTVNIYGTNGVLNNVADNITGTNVAVTGVGAGTVSDAAFMQILASGATLTQGNTYVAHYTADTGW